jgi:hypothetical protein
MKVTQEVVTVWADPLAGEVNFVLSGFRITLSAEEATHLANALAEGVDRLRQAPMPTVASAVPAMPAPNPPADPAADGPTGHSPTAAETEAIQHRTRALIQASIREKGLSLREEERV